MFLGKFESGKIMMTSKVNQFLQDNRLNANYLLGFLIRHLNGDWGNVAEKEEKANDLALENGGRLLSSYKLLGREIWIITKADRSYTTFLFPDEY